MPKSQKISDKDSSYEPFISEYERGLLSLLYAHPDLFAEFQQKASGDYFIYPPHRLIFLALHNLYSNPTVTKVDLELLHSECNSLGLASSGISSEYVVILTQSVSDKSNFDLYYQRVKSAYLKYKLQQVLDQNLSVLSKNAKDDPKALSGEDLLNNFANELTGLNSFQGSQEDGVLFADYLDSFVEERLNDPVDVRGLRTGFKLLDTTINGLMPGSLTIIAGRPGEGKSTSLLNIVDYVAIESLDPKPVLYISTEMSKEEDLSRLLAIRTAIPERTIANGVALSDPKKATLLNKAYKQIKKSKIYHIYTPDFNSTKICNYITYYKLKYDIGLAVFDYIKLDTVGDNLKDKREDQILGDLTTSIKNTAGKLNIPILAACQINTRSDRVADSDRIIRYCNNLIELSEQSEEDVDRHGGDVVKYGTHWFKLRKARAGSNKVKIPIRFWKACVKMVEAEVWTEQNPEETSITELTTPEDYQRAKEEEFSMDAVSNTSGMGELDNYLGFDLETDDLV